MKNLLFLFLLFQTTVLFSQNNFKLNWSTSLDYSILDKVQRDTNFDTPYADMKPFGYSFDLSFESGITNGHSISVGLGYSKKKFYPDWEVMFFYGGYVAHGGDTLQVQTLDLATIEFETISIPIVHKQYIKQGEQLSFYTMVGTRIDFSISKKENYESPNFWNRDDVLRNNTFSAKKRQFELFGTAVEVGGGVTYKIVSDLALLLEANAQVLEFRKAHERIATIWPDFGFEENIAGNKNQFLFFGQVSMSLGLQKSF